MISDFQLEDPTKNQGHYTSTNQLNATNFQVDQDCVNQNHKHPYLCFQDTDPHALPYTCVKNSKLTYSNNYQYLTRCHFLCLACLLGPHPSELPLEAWPPTLY